MKPTPGTLGRAAAVLWLCTPVCSPWAADETTALTVYSSAAPGSISAEALRDGAMAGPAVPGHAVVRQERFIDLAQGRNEVRFTDVAGLIDPTTVSFQSVTDPAGTRVVEQGFLFDLVSTEKLLARFVDREITVEQVRGSGTETFRGTLLSTRGGLVLQQADGSIRSLPHNASVTLPDLPGGLIRRPTLVWDVVARQAGRHRSRVSYQTGGITWWADYNLTLREDAAAGCLVDASSWVSLLNQSGATYPDARLKLVAGDVHRAAPPVAMPRALMAPMADAAAEVAGFEEKAFFEYHLYTLGRPTTLPDNATRQIELFPAVAGVPCERTLEVSGGPGAVAGPEPLVDRGAGAGGRAPVEAFLTLRNDTRSGLGVPLPAGRVRVSRLDPADGSLEFIGEDRIGHTPRDESLRLKLGNAFDVVAERRQTDFRVDTARRTMTEDIEVKLRNRKDHAVRVRVRETLFRWAGWRITGASHPHERQDARTVVFATEVAAGAEVSLRYTARYSW